MEPQSCWSSYLNNRASLADSLTASGCAKQTILTAFPPMVTLKICLSFWMDGATLLLKKNKKKTENKWSHTGPQFTPALLGPRKQLAQQVPFIVLSCCKSVQLILTCRHNRQFSGNSMDTRHAFQGHESR